MNYEQDFFLGLNITVPDLPMEVLPPAELHNKQTDNVPFVSQLSILDSNIKPDYSQLTENALPSDYWCPTVEINRPYPSWTGQMVDLAQFFSSALSYYMQLQLKFAFIF